MGLKRGWGGTIRILLSDQFISSIDGIIYSVLTDVPAHCIIVPDGHCRKAKVFHQFGFWICIRFQNRAWLGVVLKYIIYACMHGWTPISRLLSWDVCGLTFIIKLLHLPEVSYFLRSVKVIYTCYYNHVIQSAIETSKTWVWREVFFKKFDWTPEKTQ